MAFFVRCFRKDEIVFDQTGEVWRLHGVGRASLDLFGCVLDAVIMFDEIEATILGADDEIRFAIAIEIANSGTASMVSDVALREITDLLQDHLGVLAWILEEIEPIAGLVRTRNDKIVVAIIIVIHGQRPRPQAHAKVDDQVRVVLLQWLKFPIVC